MLPNVGDRIKMVQCDDKWTKLTPGSLGTVTGVNPRWNQIHVKWDNGSTLSLIEGHDDYQIV